VINYKTDNETVEAFRVRRYLLVEIDYQMALVVESG
jgi:hypothetical protein